MVDRAELQSRLTTNKLINCFNLMDSELGCLGYLAHQCFFFNTASSKGNDRRLKQVKKGTQQSDTSLVQIY